MNGHKQTMHMKDGQRVNEHIAALLGAAPAPIVLQHLGVTQQVAMREHGPFATACGAAGVHNSSQVIGLVGGRCVAVAVVGGTLQQAASAVIVERKHMSTTGLEGDFADPTKVVSTAHHHRRFGVAHKILDFVFLVGRVERQKHQARTQRGQVEHEGFDRLVDLHRHTSACWQLERLQQVGHHGAGPIEVGPAVVQAVVGFNGGGGKVSRKARPEGGIKVVTHVAVSKG